MVEARGARVVAAARLRHNPGDAELDAALYGLRPWRNRPEVRAVLTSWWQTRIPGSHLDPGGVEEVATYLSTIGGLVDGEGRSATDPANAETIGGMVAFMLVNVAAGRDNADGDWLRRTVKGIKPRTASWYHAKYRGDGMADFFAWANASRHRGDIRGLVAGGKSMAAARKWLERHPGEHWPCPGRPWRPERRA